MIDKIFLLTPVIIVLIASVAYLRIFDFQKYTEDNYEKLLDCFYDDEFEGEEDI